MSQFLTPPAVTRMMRAAIKIGDDYVTIEETITLLPTASDEEISQAVATGMRMYDVQRAAVEAQARELRELGSSQAHSIPMRDPDAPASEKQRSYMDYLLKELSWDYERLAAFAADRHLNLLTLTKREASDVIDDLKGVLAGAAEQDAANAETDGPSDHERSSGTSPQILVAQRATQRQIRAIERLVDERGIDLERELRARFGDRQLADLSMDEAGQLLSAFQHRPRGVRPRQPISQV